MSELCSSSCHFSSLLISDFFLLCSFILSHPLYFSYLIFFSPYLLNLISFLSPLFLTTFLLFLAHFQTNFTSISQTLQFKKDPTKEEEPDDRGIYEILFGPPPIAAAVVTVELQNENGSAISDQTPQKDQILEPNPFPGSGEELPTAVAGEVQDSGQNEVLKVSATPAAMEDKRLENFLKILDEFEKLASNVDGKKKIMKKQVVGPPPSPSSRGAKSDRVEKKQKSLLINGSEPTATMAKSQSQRIITAAGNDKDSLSSYGSMRREREWKRTLACKLFEERHNGAAAAGEAMDSLWETYEVESNKTTTNNNKRSEKGWKERVIEREMEEDDVIGAQLCCLQALKMSAGKMNLGVGRPNIVKISKAIKGIEWLHNLTKNSKKVHNNGDHRF